MAGPLFQALAVTRLATHGGVQAEAIDVGAQSLPGSRTGDACGYHRAEHWNRIRAPILDRPVAALHGGLIPAC